MKGLELAECYWREICEPVIAQVIPEALPHIAVGLVGEGSECLGYDDEISMDHDWGPGFCIWLDNSFMAKYGDTLRKIYSALPDEFMGYKRIRENEMSAGRVGVINVSVFYSRFLGRTSLPSTLMDWMNLNEEGLSTATNGKVFYDGQGEFSKIRNYLLNYYPEDVRLKKLAGRCAKAAQAGQYNYPRCLKRGDKTAAVLALAEFMEHVQAVFYLLNKCYRPYYKWTNRMLRDLGNTESAIASDLDDLTLGDVTDKTRQINTICEKIVLALKREHLSDSDSDFLLDHGVEIQDKVSSSEIHRLPLMLV